MTHVTVPAYAKINLTLDVHARRWDGYHDIRSIMQTVALHDTLEITRTPNAPGVAIHITGEEAGGVPADSSNIVHQAAVRMQKIAAARGSLPGNESGLHITLTKRIPSQAGLGGGSSDAAAALTAINRLFELDLSPVRLAEIGQALGADVPFFFTGGIALVQGLGEKVTPLPPFHEKEWLVIVKPPVGVSTAGAYTALDTVPQRCPGSATVDWLAGNARRLANDFQDVILASHPQIAAAYATLAVGAGPPPLLCGSGAALFRFADTEIAAHAQADKCRQAQVGTVWVTHTHRRSE